jgi:thiol-disulfide isomerase/thioredoxin/outer membrane lipoprotein-sorting protein
MLAMAAVAGCSQEKQPPSAAAAADKNTNLVDAAPANSAAGPGNSAANSAATSANSATSATTKPPAGPITASGILDRMAAVYRQAKTYADAGRITVVADVGGMRKPESAPCSVTFERPNRLRMHVYQGSLLSDGHQMRGWIDTQTADDPFAGQVLTLDSPATLTLDDIYGDDVLAGYLTQGIAGGSLQVLLLLGEEPLKEIQANSERPVLLEPQAIEGQMCHRVLMASAEGKLILWIDQQNHLLRRVELPTDKFRQHLSQEGEVKELSVTMELAGARVNEKIDADAFRMEMPADAKIVKQFDRRELLPPPPAAPALLGKAVPPFVLKDLDGQEVSHTSLAGKVAVLDFWFTTCPPCKEGLPHLQQVAQQFKDNDQVRFIAVSVDPAEIGDEKLTEMFASLKVELPIARDPEQVASKALGIAGFPTTIILGPDGVVHDFEAGANPQVPTLLPAKINKVLAGELLYKEVLAEYEKRLKEYEQSMKEPQIQKASIATRSEPKRLKIEKIFECTELKQPGNLLAVDSSDGAVILAHDGWRQVVEIGFDGSVKQKHDLPVPADEVVATLRTATGKDGKRYFLGLATSQKQVHLFDQDWKHLISYPEDKDHAGVADALLADLDGDEQLELCVSYWGVVGVQGATLEGKRLWSNRSMEHVFRLAASGPDAKGQRRLLCANGTGMPVPVDADGNNAKPISVGTHFLRAVFSADLNGDGQPEWLGLASTAAGSDMAVAFNLAGEELWNYPLPQGVQEHPTLEMVTSGKLVKGDQRHWLLAGADGSLHILSAEGELIDKFNYGAALSGLTVTEQDGTPILVIATSQAIEGWKVTAP